MAYSIIALQEANLAYHYPIVYWNCANLISDSGGEDSTVNYDKIATAVSRLRHEGINIALPDINSSDFDFKPFADDNKIVFGLKPIIGVGAAEAKMIVENRPYKSLQDFCDKIEAAKQIAKSNGESSSFGSTTVIQLIKAGAFDTIERRPRQEIMRDYIRSISSPLKSLDIGHVELIKKLGLLSDLQIQQYVKPIRFRNYVYKYCKVVKTTGKGDNTKFYLLDEKATPFFLMNVQEKLVEGKDYEVINSGVNFGYSVKRGALERELKKLLEDFKANVLENPDIIEAVNKVRCDNIWRERCPGSISKWEMQALCYYYHEHELANIDKERYNIVDFSDLPEEPVVVSEYNINEQKKPRFRLSKICGTVISKDKNHETISLLTPTGVVTVKFYKGQYNFYATDIAEKQFDGTKTILDKSWFERGTMLMATGFRSGDNFVCKKYKDSAYPHALVLINSVDEKTGELDLTFDRVKN